VSLAVTLFTDPACPFAFSAEPVRQRLRWHYGEQLTWQTRMVVVTAEPGERRSLPRARPTSNAATACRSTRHRCHGRHRVNRDVVLSWRRA